VVSVSDRAGVRNAPEERFLTRKQQRFVEEFLIDLNATQAAVRAGYSPLTARSIGSENLTKPNIQAALTRARATRRDRLEIQADTVVIELARLGFSRMVAVATWDSNGVYIHPSETLDDDTHATVKQIKATKTTVTRKNGDEELTERFEINLHDKLAALDKIARFLGMYNDSIRVDLANVDRAKLAEEFGLPEDEVEAAIAEIQEMYAKNDRENRRSV
jgi:phage terminase small subunit